jgi:hypothetical protein
MRGPVLITYHEVFGREPLMDELHGLLPNVRSRLSIPNDMKGRADLFEQSHRAIQSVLKSQEPRSDHNEDYQYCPVRR